MKLFHWLLVALMLVATPKAALAKGSKADEIRALKAQVAQLKTDLDQERTDHASQVASLKSAHQNDVGVIQQSHQVRLDELQTQHEAAIGERVEAYNKLVDDANDALDKADARHARLQARLGNVQRADAAELADTRSRGNRRALAMGGAGVAAGALAVAKPALLVGAATAGAHALFLGPGGIVLIGEHLAAKHIENKRVDHNTTADAQYNQEYGEWVAGGRQGPAPVVRRYVDRKQNAVASFFRPNVGPQEVLIRDEDETSATHGQMVSLGRVKGPRMQRLQNAVRWAVGAKPVTPHADAQKVEGAQEHQASFFRRPPPRPAPAPAAAAAAAAHH